MQRCMFIVHTCLKYTSTGFQLFVSNHTLIQVLQLVSWSSVPRCLLSKCILSSVTLQQVYCPTQCIVPWCSLADRLTLSRSDNAAPPCTICTQPLRAIVCRPVPCTYSSTHSLLHCAHCALCTLCIVYIPQVHKPTLDHRLKESYNKYQKKSNQTD